MNTPSATHALLLIGIGGGGIACASAIHHQCGDDVRTLLIDTAPNVTPDDGIPFLLIGGARLAGQGSGGDAITARLAAQDDINEIIPHLADVHIAIICTCLGAGTGGGATPEIVRFLQERNITTLVFATLPFIFEGNDRMKAAVRAIPLIETHANTLVTLPMDALCATPAEGTLTNALATGVATLAAGVSLLWQLIGKPGFIYVDAAHLQHLVAHAGHAVFATARATGETRTTDVMAALNASPTLTPTDGETPAVTGMLIGIIAGDDLRLAEISAIMTDIRFTYGSECPTELGIVRDPAQEGSLCVTVLLCHGNATPSRTTTNRIASNSGEPPIIDPMSNGYPRKRTRGLSFGTQGLDRFKDTEHTLYNNEDLDIPTFHRRNITIDR